MKLLINFLTKPTDPEAALNSIARPTGDFDTLEDARKIALLYASKPTIEAYSVQIESDDGGIAEAWVRDGAGWKREGG
jgi:hypothetical protein